ncbi:hypothetical protein CRYUN_Cryun10bG0110900 [Craigia yunnanensis]
MDSMGAISEGEWSSLSGMYTTEEADFMAQLLNIANTSSYSFSQGSSYSAGSSILFPSSSQESYYLKSDSHPIFVANNSPMSMDFCMEDATNTSFYLVEGDDCLKQEIGNGNVEQAENSKKRSRSSGDVQKNRRNARSKKNQSSVSTTNNDRDGNAGLNGQSSASCSSEDYSNASQELNGGMTSSSKGEAALDLNGKTRASREAATDPQSLYARKRRERINERLRILQNLVPNGTKLLSSDDLWMYAPIAYNGMDIGLDL